jgi:hypothetical protein
MPQDLRKLWQACQVSADAAENEQVWLHNLRTAAKGGDLLCYGLYVHGEQADELRGLATSIHALVMTLDTEQHRNTIHVCPPEHGKTALARWEMEMWLGIETEGAFENPKHTVPSAQYIMNTALQAEKQIMEIENTVEHNRRYRELFPRARPDKKKGWTKDHFFLDRPRSRPDPSLHGVGMFGPIQGSRVGFQAIDDPTDQQDARSELLLRTQNEWLAGTAADRVMRGGIRRLRMTRWSEKDPYSRLCKVQGMWARVMPALGFWQEHPEYGMTSRALWPDVWPEERLEAKRQELIDAGQAYLWALTYLCNPVVSTGDMFRRDWFIYGVPPREGVAV